MQINGGRGESELWKFELDADLKDKVAPLRALFALELGGVAVQHGRRLEQLVLGKEPLRVPVCGGGGGLHSGGGGDGSGGGGGGSGGGDGGARSLYGCDGGHASCM